MTRGDFKFGKKLYNGISKINQITLIRNFKAYELNLIPSIREQDSKVPLYPLHSYSTFNTIKTATKISQRVQEDHRCRIFEW